MVDVAINPDEPPLPDKVSCDQAKRLAEAGLRGQPHKASIATTLFKDKIQQLKDQHHPRTAGDAHPDRPATLHIRDDHALAVRSMVMIAGLVDNPSVGPSAVGACGWDGRGRGRGRCPAEIEFVGGQRPGEEVTLSVRTLGPA